MHFVAKSGHHTCGTGMHWVDWWDGLVFVVCIYDVRYLIYHRIGDLCK